MPVRINSLFPKLKDNLTPVTGISADSRKIQPGFVFAALPGALADGRAFAEQAVSKGAVAVIAPQNSGLSLSVPVIESDNPRQTYAWAAAAFYAGQPEIMVAVTGTNGKTSTATFCRQIWENLGLKAASIGTLGIEAEGLPPRPSLTTPDPADLHQALAELRHLGITHGAMEASSHGLDQYRLDGVRLKAAAFTNFTRDHLDYHQTEAAYFAAKARVLELLPKGAPAVLNADITEFQALAAKAQSLGLEILDFGRNAKALKVLSTKAHSAGQHLELEVLGQHVFVDLPLAGTFQAMNALTALGLVMGAGLPAHQVLPVLSTLKGVNGRLQQAARLKNGAAIYVDYAHTPDALETVLSALRPHVSGRLICVMGCGGDRDAGKRPQMGKVAIDLADHVIVTDDNPRSEDPALIRKAILKAAIGAEEIGDRAQAIQAAIEMLQSGDILVLAGKGHETGQIINGVSHPFSDVEEARKAVLKVEGAAS